MRLRLHNTSAGFQLLGQNFADLVHPRCLNLWCWSLEETNNESINSDRVSSSSTVGQSREGPYLHYKNLISGVTPYLKLLVVSFSVLCNAHRTHLREQ